MVPYILLIIAAVCIVLSASYPPTLPWAVLCVGLALCLSVHRAAATICARLHDTETRALRRLDTMSAALRDIRDGRTDDPDKVRSLDGHTLHGWIKS